MGAGTFPPSFSSFSSCGVKNSVKAVCVCRVGLPLTRPLLDRPRHFIREHILYIVTVCLKSRPFNSVVHVFSSRHIVYHINHNHPPHIYTITGSYSSSTHTDTDNPFLRSPFFPFRLDYAYHFYRLFAVVTSTRIHRSLRLPRCQGAKGRKTKILPTTWVTSPRSSVAHQSSRFTTTHTAEKATKNSMHTHEH